MQWTEIAAPVKPHAGRGADAAVDRPASARSAERGPSLASRHPRHRPGARAEPRRPAVKSLWKLPQPWTPRTRPPLLGKPTERVFHELPQAVSSRSEGDISISLRMGTFLFRVDNS